MKRLAIVGAGELGRQILHLSLQDSEITVVGFYDDNIPAGTTATGPCKVVGATKDILRDYHANAFDCLAIAIGYRHMNQRKALFDRFSTKIPFVTLVHSSCQIDGSAKIGNGTMLYPGCIIDKNVVVEDNVLLNLGVVIAHDSVVGSHCYLAPRAVLSGFVSVRDRCFLGTGAIISDTIEIVSNCIVGAGAVVVKNIDEGGVYVGNPAKKIIQAD